MRYFLDIDEKREAWKFIGNPFECYVAYVSDELQEEFNSLAEEDLKKKNGYSEVQYVPVYLFISHQAFWIMTMSGFTCLSEAMVYIFHDRGYHDQVQEQAER